MYNLTIREPYKPCVIFYYPEFRQPSQYICLLFKKSYVFLTPELGIMC